ncbi:NAD(P)H-dependent oxidoreductase [Aquimarina spongiae]|uniref:SnoaL-like domain-containing protein n=1 Tax=Aquimarina spongiae TaxID=570521 RepID=A0A1M6HDH5_9FLAO|nr:NAD(P)H-dependent oxidoreductase [Aquimarina spongiae]SHJ20270.1 SnoaL-like domain-containing protein [Aquimarina spongiae]
MKNILAFSGSNSQDSINEKLIHSVIKRYPNHDIRFIDLKKFETPIYSPQIQATGIPKSIQELYAIFQESEGFIIASPEHNGLPSAFLKNTLDWLSVITQRFFGEKPVLLLSTSPGATGARTHLSILAKLIPLWGGVLSATYSLGSFNEAFDTNQNVIKDATELQHLGKAFSALVASNPKPKKTNAEVVQAYFNAFQQGDLEAVLNVFHPDCYIVSVKEEERPTEQLHGIYRTRKEAKQFLNNIVALFETKSFVVETVVEAADNLVVAKGTFSHLVKSSGKLFNSNWVQLCVIEDEMIKEYRFYEDSAALIEASTIEYA